MATSRIVLLFSFLTLAQSMALSSKAFGIHFPGAMRTNLVQEVIDRLKVEHLDIREEIKKVKHKQQVLTSSSDALSELSKTLDRYLRRKRHTYRISFSGTSDTVSVKPYCGVNSGDSLTDTFTNVTLKALKYFLNVLEEDRVEVISCMTSVITDFTQMIGNGSVIIKGTDSGEVQEAVSAANVSLQVFIENVGRELDHLEMQEALLAEDIQRMETTIRQDELSYGRRETPSVIPDVNAVITEAEPEGGHDDSENFTSESTTRSRYLGIPQTKSKSMSLQNEIKTTKLTDVPATEDAVTMPIDSDITTDEVLTTVGYEDSTTSVTEPTVMKPDSKLNYLKPVISGPLTKRLSSPSRKLVRTSQDALPPKDLISQLNSYKDKLERTLTNLQEDIRAIGDIPSLLEKLQAAINSKNYIRTVSFHISNEHSEDEIAISPYCLVDDEVNMLSVHSQYLLFPILRDLNTSITTGSTDQVLCLSALLREIARAIENRELSIKPEDALNLNQLILRVKTEADTKSSSLLQSSDRILIELDMVNRQLQDKQMPKRELTGFLSRPAYPQIPVIQIIIQQIVEEN